VKDYLATGKTLPSYLTPSADGAPANPAPSAPTAPTLDTASVSTAAAPAAGVAAAAPATITAVAAPPPPTVIADDPAPVTPPVPMPASARPKGEPAAPVTEADLKDWKSGSLEDYLRQHGLLNGATTTAAAGN
jgi:hypothetical protein